MMFKMRKLLIILSLFCTFYSNNIFANDLNLLCGNTWQFKIKNPSKFAQTEVFIKYDNSTDLVKSKLISSNEDIFVFEARELYSSDCYTEISARYYIDRNLGTLRKKIINIKENTVKPKESLIDYYKNDEFWKSFNERFKDSPIENAKKFCKPSLGFINVLPANQDEIIKNLEKGNDDANKYFELLKTSTCKTLSKKF